jgi:N-formylglutamate deformylase
MSEVFSFTSGDTPILVSMPHSGLQIPDDIFSRFSERAKTLPDTDWHIPKLYNFASERGHTVLQANYGRYLVDLNRPPNNESLYPGQSGTGLCPETLFDGEDLYASGETLSASEIEVRRQHFWQPYHDKLAQTLRQISAKFGYAILYDAHSIASRVPRLFDGRLADLNLGTASGQSCSAEIQAAVFDVIESSGYSAVLNGRFQGGYITRHYGDPESNVHAVQMEIAQCTYMDEAAGFKYKGGDAKNLQETLIRVFDALSAVSPVIPAKAGI